MIHEILRVYSLDTIGVPRDEQHDQIWLPKAMWHRLMHLDCPDVILLRVTQEIEEKVIRVLTMGQSHDLEQDTCYVPYWCIGAFVEGEECDVERHLSIPPEATKIVVQPLDSELYHCDISTAVSSVLQHWNVLERHTTLTVPCEELGGYLVDVFIKDFEPEGARVLLRGEVPLDLAEPIVELPGAVSGSESKRPDSPWAEPAFTQPVFTHSTSVASQFDFGEEEESTYEKKAFQPFGGKGHSLR